jgi:hypothetical protein
MESAWPHSRAAIQDTQIASQLPHLPCAVGVTALLKEAPPARSAGGENLRLRTRGGSVRIRSL